MRKIPPPSVAIFGLHDETGTIRWRLQRLTNTGFAAANQLVARMTELGILREITGNARNRRFRYEPYVRLFTDD